MVRTLLSRVGRTAVVVSVAVLLGGEFATTASATPSRSAVPALRYAVIKAECPQPTDPQHKRCTALRRVDVPKGTRGSFAYERPDYATGPAGGFTPADLATAYGVNTAAATSQTVAVVAAFDDPYALAELNTFDSRYGIPRETSTSFRKVNQNGASAPLPVANRGWAGEIALDVQAIRGLCRRCRILLVETANNLTTNLAAGVNTAVRLGAKVVNNSYSGPEGSESAAVRAAFNHPGVVLTASAGNDGWYSWDLANFSGGYSRNRPDTPAAFPTVVAVGGTTLQLNPDATRGSETVWNSNGPHNSSTTLVGGSGGGCSRIYAAPAWQSAAVGYASTGCAGKRLSSDVAAVGDPKTGYDVYSRYVGWRTTGGTSLASAVIAGLWGLAGGPGGLAYPAQALYQNYRHRPGSSYDVTGGSNGFCGGDTKTVCANAVKALTGGGTGNPNNLANGNSVYPGGWAGLLDCGFAYDRSENVTADDTQCYAAPGFDGVAGVGTPNGSTVFRPTSPLISVTLPVPVKRGVPQAYVARAAMRLAGALPTGYVWNWGDGTAKTTVSSASLTTTVRHTYARAGRYTLTVTIRDSSGQSASTSNRLTLGLPPVAVISGPARARAGQSYRWSSVGSYDPNTGGRLTTVRWSWGDGTRSVIGVSATHRYARRGTFTITIRVWDNSGLSTTRTRRQLVVR